MSEQSSSSHHLESPAPAAGKKSDSQFRIVADDDAVVFPDDVEPTDDSPTIISSAHAPSSQHPSRTRKQSNEALSGSLRGRKLAHFELIEPIGVGGMAAVIRARDTQLDRFVALKILPPEMANDEENIRRFHQEARAAAKLDHENIARVFFCGEDQRLHFIAFEFVEGQNLRTILDRRGQLPVIEAVRIVLQIASGLDHASDRGVVHRDIKPSNIIISSNGRAKLVDMGLARSQEPHSNQALTQSGVTLGTFDYLSPEQALEPREADSRSDIYSLGCTFYHMLTGQAPVPEGTAARKLHHHQYVAPVDPRQLNPAIPDEVAAILMRMMAKDPKERYQRPIHLVHHLYQVAKQIGASEDVPEGMMFLDAPLPGAPRLRPLLTISLAALGLAALLMLLSLTPPEPIEQKGSPFQRNNASDQAANTKTKIEPKSNVVIDKGKAPLGVISTTKDFAQAMEDKLRSAVPILVENNIQLPPQGLVSKGDRSRQLVVKARTPGKAKLTFAYQPEATTASAQVAGLTLDGGSILFEDLIIEIEADGTPVLPVAGLAVRGNTSVRFVRCTFTQKNPEYRAFIPEKNRLFPLASVLVENPGTDTQSKPLVTFEECYWRQGQAAVCVDGPAEINAHDCAFGPHGALFHMRGNAREFGTALRLKHCSAFVVQGPAFRIDDNASCLLETQFCIFSSAGPLPANQRDEIHLIRQTDAREPIVRYIGRRNCYHNLNAFWSWPVFGGASTTANLDAFRDEVTRMGGQDALSTVADTSPWLYEEPLLKLSSPLVAFQVNPTLRDVRTADGASALGVGECVWGKMPTLTPLPTERPVVTDNKFKPKPFEKIIDPTADDSTPGVYQSLTKAIPFAKAGDVLLLKHGTDSRDIDIKTIKLDDPKCNVTIKPFPGFSPVLVLADRTQEKDASLFRLFDGKLQFENIEFQLEPQQLDFRAQSVVALGGRGVCSFKNCVVTLRNSEGRVPVSLVTFLDPEDVMNMPLAIMPRPQAQIELSSCLVRGEGDLVTVRSSRPFQLSVDNSILALSGSMVLVKGNNEVPMEPAAHIKMSRVTAFLGESLVLLRGKGPKSLALTRCDLIRDCQFIALGDIPFIQLDKVDASEETLRQYFEWKGERNAYVNMVRMLEIFRPEDTFNLASLFWETDSWQKTEPDARWIRARYNMPPLNLRPLSQMNLDHFKAREEFRETLLPFGAQLRAEDLPNFTEPRTSTSPLTAP